MKEGIVNIILGSVVITTLVYTRFYFFVRRDSIRNTLVNYVLYLLTNTGNLFIIFFYFDTIAENYKSFSAITYNIFFFLEAIFYFKFIGAIFNINKRTAPRLAGFLNAVVILLYLQIVPAILFRYFDTIDTPIYYLNFLLLAGIVLLLVICIFRYVLRVGKHLLHFKIVLAGGIVNFLFIYFTLYIHTVPDNLFFSDFEDRFTTGLVVFAIGKFIEIVLFSFAVSLNMRDVFVYKLAQLKKSEYQNSINQMEIVELKEKNELLRLEEQRKIGRDLHDIVANAIATAKMQMHYIKGQSEPGEFSNQVEEVIGQLSAAYNDVRLKSHDLYIGSDKESAKHFIKAFYHYTKLALPDYAFKKDIHVEEAAARMLSVDEKISFLFILREAISDIISQPSVNEVTISLREENDAVLLTIIDNRTNNIEATQPESEQIVRIREKVDHMRGTLKISSGVKSAEMEILIPILN